jgi:hypothetical protein
MTGSSHHRDMLRLICTALFLVGICLQHGSPTISQVHEPDIVQNVDICDVLSSPLKYDKKLLKMTGFGSHGFEDSSFWSPTCTSSNTSIWMEYGGNTATGTMYCCGVAATRSRQDAPKVEGIKVPLKNDEVFRKFDELLHRPPSSIARATLIGRFFAGNSDGIGKLMGYGHMGCCSLLVVQEVVNVEPEDNELDQRSDSNEYDSLENFSSYRYREIPAGNELIERQKNAEAGNSAWQFTDHRRVVSEQLSAIASFDKKSLEGLRIVKQSSGRVVYKLNDRDKSFLVVAIKPYWLSFYARDRKKVIWTVASLVESPYQPGDKIPGGLQ